MSITHRTMTAAGATAFYEVVAEAITAYDLSPFEAVGVLEVAKHELLNDLVEGCEEGEDEEATDA